LTSTPPSPYNIHINEKESGLEVSKVIVRTEKWNTKQGAVIKAVVRTPEGTFIGATNQTKVTPQTIVIVGK
jgi:hypothetical protein